MIEFNLEKALNGAKVITRDGREVTQLTLFNATSDGYCLYAVIDNVIVSFTKDGYYNEEKKLSGYDLFMAPEMLSGFVNVYDDGGLTRHANKEHADDTAKGQDRIACIDLSQFPVGYGLED